MNDLKQRPVATCPRRAPAWLVSVICHIGLFGVAAALMPVIVFHQESFGPPIQVIRHVEPEERILPRWEPQVEMPPSPTVEVVLEPVQEAKATDEEQPLAGDVLPDSGGEAEPSGAYPVCAVGVRTRPRPVRPAAKPVPAPAVEKPKAPPAVPVVPPPPVVEPEKGPSRTARVLGGLSPRYPSRQQSKGNTATVLLLIRLDEKGRPADVQLLSEDVHPDFVEAAIAAAKRAHYEPALVNGKPAASDIRVRIRFQLR